MDRRGDRDLGPAETVATTSESRSGAVRTFRLAVAYLLPTTFNAGVGTRFGLGAATGLAFGFAEALALDLAFVSLSPSPVPASRWAGLAARLGAAHPAPHMGPKSQTTGAAACRFARASKSSASSWRGSVIRSVESVRAGTPR